MNFLKNTSLRVKLLFLSAVTVVVTGAGAWLSLQHMADSYEASVYKRFERFTIQMGNALAAQFFERYGDVQAFAINDSIRSGDSSRIREALNSYVSLYGIYDVILVVDKKGRYVGSNSKDVSGREVNTELLRNLNYSNEKWFQATLSGQTSDMKEKNFAGTFFEDFVEDKIVSTAFGVKSYGSSFSAAIRDENGDVLGVITNRASEKWIQPDITATFDLLKKMQLESAQILIINSKGQTIQDFRNSKFQNGNILGSSYYDSDKLFQPAASQGKVGSYDIPAQNSKATEIVSFSSIDSPKWIDSFDWKVVVGVPKSDAMANVESAVKEFMVLMAVACILALTISVLFSVYIAKTFNSATALLSKNSDELNEASVRIAAQSTELSESATEQAAALQQTMSAVDEISAMVEKNAEAAGRSKEVSENSKQAAERGRGIVEQMISAMGEIDSANNEISSEMNESNKQLNEITQLINDIGSKTKVINEIVFQTKLLSFNASVEAARAGEYGKGFSVVAEEVGNLAQMSGNAAKEISTLLDESVRKVNQIVAESKSRVDKIIQSSKHKVEAGAQVARDCNEALEEILTNVANVDNLVSEIAVASNEQSAGIKEISKAVGQMEQVTQQNSTVAQESSTAAEQLRAQSTDLHNLVLTVARHVNGASDESMPHRTGTPSTTQNLITMPKRAQTAQRSHLPKKAAGSEYVPSGSNSGFGDE
jgi:methyl-accepting chemotaxis protein